MLSLFKRPRRASAAQAPRAVPAHSAPDEWNEERRRLLEAQRAPLREVDRTLALETRLWMLRLPPKLRPTTLAEAYPRVANRIARDWVDGFMIDVCFEDLLIDRRGGRRGFPASVLHEIRRLHHFNRRHRVLIEQRMLRGKAQTLPAGATDAMAPLPVLDDAMAIDWEPTETIVVTEGVLRRR
jgi:hypothetical protein